jgi:hypothetical protein
MITTWLLTDAAKAEWPSGGRIRDELFKVGRFRLLSPPIPSGNRTLNYGFASKGSHPAVSPIAPPGLPRICQLLPFLAAIFQGPSEA